MYRINNESYSIPYGDKFILYAPLEKNIMIINKAANDIIEKIRNHEHVEIDSSSAFYKELIENCIILKKNTGQDQSIFLKRNKNYNPGGVSLFLTTKCSMKCVYCYASGGDGSRTMSWKLAKASLDWILKNAIRQKRRNIYIAFHGGGEIATVMPLMKKCVDYAKSNSGDLKISFSSGLNGIIQPQDLHWVINNIQSVTMSLDGLPEIQNKQRPLKNGKESFGSVYETLKILDEKNFNYAIRTTVTNLGLEILPESIEYICRNFKTKTIQIEPFFPVGRAVKNELQPVSSKLFVDKFREAKKKAEDYGVRLKYSGARFPLITNTFCKACTESFAVTPDGNLTSCYEVSESDDPRSALFFFGYYNDKTGRFVFDEDKINRLRELNVENKPNCSSCFCKWHCAGDCPAKIALNGNALDTLNNDRCYINRELTKDQLIDTLNTE